MARARKAESAQEPGDAAQPEANSPPAGAPGSDEGVEEHKSKWLARFPAWLDADAGVHLIEDRQNRRMTIKFDEKPAAPVREVMKVEYGYRFDGENQLWYKKMNPATPRQDREEAEQLAFTVANMIREERGLEQKQSFSIGM
jgi:hypothetical protein